MIQKPQTISDRHQKVDQFSRLRNLSKTVHNILSNPVGKQTDKQTERETNRQTPCYTYT